MSTLRHPSAAVAIYRTWSEPQGASSSCPRTSSIFARPEKPKRAPNANDRLQNIARAMAEHVPTGSIAQPSRSSMPPAWMAPKSHTPKVASRRSHRSLHEPSGQAILQFTRPSNVDLPGSTLLGRTERVGRASRVLTRQSRRKDRCGARVVQPIRSSADLDPARRAKPYAPSCRRRRSGLSGAEMQSHLTQRRY